MARPKPLADFIAPCLGPTLAAQGFAAADIIVAWPEIVGERLSRHTEPVKIEWPRGHRSSPDERPPPATLVVKVTSAFALELQHCAPLVIERVNTHFGWRCVGRLSLRQGPVKRALAPARSALAPDPVREGQVNDAVAGVADEGLRAALTRLGRAVLAGAGKGCDPTKP